MLNIIFVKYHLFFVSILTLLFDAQASVDEMGKCWKQIVPCNIEIEQRREAHAQLGKLFLARNTPEDLAEAFFHLRKSLYLGCKGASSQLAIALQAEEVQITNDQEEFDLFCGKGETEGDQDKRIRLKLSLFFLLEHSGHIKVPGFLGKYFEEIRSLSIVSPLYWKYERIKLLGQLQEQLPSRRFRTMSFGSCLSNWIGNAIARVSGMPEEKVFTIKRCRSDYFNNSFIKGLFSVHLTEFDPRCANLDVVRDQTDLLGYGGISIGCLGPHHFGSKKEKPWAESFAKEDLDLIIIDNYADIKFKVARFKKNPKKFIFCVPSSIINFDSILTLDSEYLSIEESIHHFNEVISFFKREKPRAKIVFVHFPFGADPNKSMHERETLMRESFFRDDILILSEVVGEKDITDFIAHFTPHFYNQLAERILNWFFEKVE